MIGRLAALSIYLGPSVLISLGYSFDFDPRTMRWAALACLLAGGPALLHLLGRGKASPVDKAMTAYLGLAFIGFWLWPGGLGRLLSAHPAAFLYLVFLIVALAPPLWGGLPFTGYWARRRTPEAVWETEVFQTINRRMSLVWILLFALCGLVALAGDLIPALGTPGWKIALGVGFPLVLLAGFGAPFNRWYPDYYQRRLGLEPVHVSSFPAPAPARAENETVKGESAMNDKPLVVALNGSPRPDISNTGQIIEMLRQPLAEEGFDLEVINLAEHEIRFCQGDAWCLAKGRCWQKDDWKGIAARLLEAQAVVLGCPVYIMNVPAQMKVFLDRSLPLGHKPRPDWKPGLTVVASAGLAEIEVAAYLDRCLKLFGAFPLGSLTAMGSGGPGEFVGKEHLVLRATDLAKDLARAVKEKRRMPANENDLRFYHFMGDLVTRSRKFMEDDYLHWEKLGLFDGFGSYVKQEMSQSPTSDPELTRAWIKTVIDRETAKHKGETKMTDQKDGPQGAKAARSCKELITHMPSALNAEAAAGLTADLQFEISGDEEFTAYLHLEDGKAVYNEGPSPNPTLTIKSPADVWLAVSRGELNGQQAFMSGQFKAEGDFGLLMQLNNLFKG